MSPTPFESGKKGLQAGPSVGPVCVRSLPVGDWPAADQLAWEVACRPAERLKRGGTAAHLKPVTRNDLARRYGYFLDHIKRSEGLSCDAETASYVTPERVARFLAELKARVRSVTVYGSIYKLRRMAQLLTPDKDFIWLTELEKDLALVMQPRTKFDRVVWSEILVEAGITLMAEADAAGHRSDLARARQFRDGLMVALLAMCPIRLKNFSTLEIGRTFMRVNGSWWIVLPASETKERRADERAVPEFLTSWIDRYLDTHRPTLVRTDTDLALLWLSSNNGYPLTYSSVERAISAATLVTIGTATSPHLFRTAAASTSAIRGGSTPNLASALLHHSHVTITEEHYNRASSLTAGQTYAALMRSLRNHD
jgi:site-specific recombinase XerD